MNSNLLVRIWELIRIIEKTSVGLGKGFIPGDSERQNIIINSISNISEELLEYLKNGNNSPYTTNSKNNRIDLETLKNLTDILVDITLMKQFNIVDCAMSYFLDTIKRLYEIESSIKKAI